MRAPTIAVVRRHLEAFNAGNLSGLLDTFSDNAVWITGQEKLVGREALGTFFANAIDGLRPQLETRREVFDDRAVFVELIERLHHDGTEHVFSIAAVFDVVDERITAAKIYREGSADLA